MRYAAQTTVPVARSRAELERLLSQRGATSFAFGWNVSHDTLQFGWHEYLIRFTLPRVDAAVYAKSPAGRRRVPQQVAKAVADADRQRWRALLLVVKAKLEAVEAGISLFESEFLAFVVLQDGSTVGDVLVPRLMEKSPLHLEAHR